MKVQFTDNQNRGCVWFLDNFLRSVTFGFIWAYIACLGLQAYLGHNEDRAIMVYHVENVGTCSFMTCKIQVQDNFGTYVALYPILHKTVRGEKVVCRLSNDNEIPKFLCYPYNPTTPDSP